MRNLSHAAGRATLNDDTTFIAQTMAMNHAMLLAAMLTFGPPSSEVSRANTSSNATPEYTDAVAAVEAAMLEINTDPEHAGAALEAALVHLRSFAPLLAGDPEALELRTMAELALARAQLAAGDRFAASATIDATLEALGGRSLDVAALGPSLGALVEERAAALAARGVARLRIECSVACRVLIDERNAGDVSEPGSARELSVPLGSHRVWVESTNPDQLEPLRTTVALDSADAVVTLRYPAPEAPAPQVERRRDASIALPSARARIAPRWAELTPLAVGGAAMIAGAVLWAIDSKCPRGADITDIVACPELYDTRTAGIALVSAGFAAGLTGGVLLIVDETRVGDRRSRELGLVWTTRF